MLDPETASYYAKYQSPEAYRNSIKELVDQSGGDWSSARWFVDSDAKTINHQLGNQFHQSYMNMLPQMYPEETANYIRNLNTKLEAGDYSDFGTNLNGVQPSNTDSSVPASAPASTSTSTPTPSSTSEPAPEPWNFEYGANKTPAITNDFESNQSNNALSNNVDTINSYMEDSDSFNSFAPAPLPMVSKKGSVFEDVMNATRNPSTSAQTFANVIANTY